MRSILSEKNLVVILFVMVLITFSLAQEDSREMEKIYSGSAAGAAAFSLKTSKSTIAALPVQPLTTASRY